MRSYISPVQNTVQVYIALGSNIGNREEFLACGRGRLQCLVKGNWMESSLCETLPMGPADQGLYLNQVVGFVTDWAPLRILHYLKGVEWVLGRQKRGHWAAREIDLDLLCWGGVRRRYHAPLLPHPRLRERLFVLDPLCEIAPHWRDPVTGLTARQLQAQLIRGSAVDTQGDEVAA